MAESPKQGTEEMETALRKALAVAPGLGEARGLLAELHSIRDWDWKTAEREYQLALERGAPAFVHMMYGWGLATRGRFPEAHAQLRLAQDQEPVSLDPRFFEALVYYIEGRFGEAKKLLRGILNLNADSPRPRFMGAAGYAGGKLRGSRTPCGVVCAQTRYADNQGSAGVGERLPR